ncbi:hypothetical protein B0A48_17819 [Cryoendolithus antarcticus]|uniref:Heterokaryon incompatibility domain-containing protein n=1 Tax=Cryoendolithus antarcticus TaxID=1507870 RepID=A0A1V8SB53_9PEZI|nr:hypothetical protein B0A48_17819 [Cryoendolithus antarcticus]
METLSAGSIFRHDRLPDAKTHIRLLEVLTARSDAITECRLTYWAVAAAPPYIAISYTWGDPLEVSEIIVNAAKLEVRNNCVQVLRQANHHGPGYYWVDAICINQLDDQEKSSQVKMMGAIFRKATTVLACVGVHSTADDSIYLCKFLRKHERTLLDYAQFERIYDIKFTLPWIARSAWWRFRHSLKVQTRVLRALFALISRPYFRRAWVAQEIFGATEPVMYCDMDTCAVSSIAALIIISSWNDEKWFSRFAAKLHISSRPGHSWLRQRVFASSLEACEKLNGLEETVSKFTHNATTVASLAHRNPDRHFDLTTAMMDSMFTNAEDPRDKIYAMMGLLKPDTRAMIVVDYSYTAFELATGFISVILNCRERGFEEPAWLNDRYMYILGLTLKIEASDPALLAEIAGRVNTPLARAAKPAKLRRRIRMSGWTGLQVHDLDGARFYVEAGTNTPDLKNSTASRQAFKTVIYDAAGSSIAVVAHNVLPGDWIVQMSAAERQARPGVVLRKCAGCEHFEIICPAILLRSFSKDTQTTRFTMDFDLWDFSTMLYLYRAYFATRLPKLQILADPRGVTLSRSRSLDREMGKATNRYARQLETSSASRSHSLDREQTAASDRHDRHARVVEPRVSDIADPPTQLPFVAPLPEPPIDDRSDDDFWQYFSVAVCHRPKSSFAAREEAS